MKSILLPKWIKSFHGSFFPSVGHWPFNHSPWYLLNITGGPGKQHLLVIWHIVCFASPLLMGKLPVFCEQTPGFSLLYRLGYQMSPWHVVALFHGVAMFGWHEQISIYSFLDDLSWQQSISEDGRHQCQIWEVSHGYPFSVDTLHVACHWGSQMNKSSAFIKKKKFMINSPKFFFIYFIDKFERFCFFIYFCGNYYNMHLVKWAVENECKLLHSYLIISKYKDRQHYIRQRQLLIALPNSPPWCINALRYNHSSFFMIYIYASNIFSLLLHENRQKYILLSFCWKN